ncbi:Sir2 family transcriptional regulator, partial [Rhizoctonia solani 123E]
MSQTPPAIPTTASKPTLDKARIPTLRTKLKTNWALFNRFQQNVLAPALRVTVVCGAGISTYAGIPDFRSDQGLYTKAFGQDGLLLGSELFGSRTLRDPTKLIAYNQALAQMRILARGAVPTSCHRYIEALSKFGRLLRCYTQNIDGLQTRDYDNMEDMVVELHGTNVYLRCHKCGKRPQEPTTVFDEILLQDGYAECPQCITNPQLSGSDIQLRKRDPGALLPDVLLNEGSYMPTKSGKTLGEMMDDDSNCDLLLIIGTSLRSTGAAGLVKGLAKGVHTHGGVVVYVNLTALAPSVWSNYIDLHIEVEIEEWARD